MCAETFQTCWPHGCAAPVIAPLEVIDSVAIMEHCIYVLQDFPCAPLGAAVWLDSATMPAAEFCLLLSAGLYISLELFGL